MLSAYFVRHGQTDYSLANRFCGAVDAPLNATGLAMAEAIAARYGDEKWAAIYASPLTRARDTAAPTARAAGMQIAVEDGLREIAYGEWEGRPEAEVERDDGERFHAWAAHPARVAPPGGETAVAIAARAMAALDAIRARHADGKVLIVSHKATLRILFCALLGIDVDLFRSRIAQKVAAVSIVDFKKTGPLLQVLGDVSHLPPELLAGDGT
ncbi:MAG TPA: histidine phosphatase family protein [Polyangia bacterium]|nr:histidine phosphatase family protein [Polyangia bacterium]